MEVICTLYATMTTVFMETQDVVQLKQTRAFGIDFGREPGKRG